MVDWLTWPAELVLSAGGIVASWFVSKDSLSFVALQMGFALLVLAPSYPCLRICRRWLDIGDRVHKLIAIPSPTLHFEAYQFFMNNTPLSSRFNAKPLTPPSCFAN